MEELTLEWEDGTYWVLSWCQDAGSFFAQRWDTDEGEPGYGGPLIETPGPDLVMVEDLDTLEAVMGRPLPGPVRVELEADAVRDPVTDEMRAAWRPESAIGICRLHPVAGWIDTFAPPGHPSPFDDQWLPEAEAWYLDEVLSPGDDECEGV